jgi:hypothetical protein
MAGSFGFIDIGNGYLLVTDESTGLPYAIQSKAGAALLGGGGGSSPVIKSAGGIILGPSNILQGNVATNIAAGLYGFAQLDTSGKVPTANLPTISGVSIYNALAGSGGVAGVQGDLLVGNAPTSGVWGSGSGVLGIPVLDASGNFVGIWIPRTNTSLTTLEGLAGNLGELGVATGSIPAIVQFTGTAGSSFTYFPFTSTMAGSITGSGSVTTAIPCMASIVRLSIGSAITGVTATLQAGYIDGQPLTVEIVSTGASVTSLIVNGQTVVSSTNAITSLVSLTPAKALILNYKWNSATSSWVDAAAATFVRNPLDEPSAIEIGVNNVASGVNSVAIGSQNIVDSQVATAIGYANRATGVGAFSVGQNSIAIGIGATAFGFHTTALADFAFNFSSNANVVFGSSGLGINGNVYGNNAIGIGNGTGVGVIGNYSIGLGGGTGNQNQLSAAYSITSATGTLAAGPTLVLTTVAGLEAGQSVIVSCTVPATASSVAAVTYGTSTIMSVTPGTNTVVLGPVTTSVGTAIQVAGGFLYETQGGYGSVSIGYNTSLTLNQGEFAFSSFNFAKTGDAQSVRAWLGMPLASGATSGQATTDLTGSVNTNLQYGNSNRYQLNKNQAVVVEATILIKGTGVAHAYMAKRRFLASKGATGNTVTISSVQVIGTDAGFGATAYSTTWVATPPFAIAANSTYGSVDVTFTGTMPEAGVMLCTFETIAAVVS